jgi:hypothetical protein
VSDKSGLYYAVIQDDAGDATYGPPETYANAAKRLNDALTSPRNVGGEIKEVE